jgi:peptide/nickel transport system substrate-binding protein
MMAVYDALWSINPTTQEIVPRQATSVTANADSTVWTIKLRPDLKFTDGTTLDANAVVSNWNRLADPATACTCLSTMKSFTWSAVNPTTVRVTMASSRPSFPADALVGGSASAMSVIASPAALQKYGDKYGTSPDTTVGAGAFTLKEWVRADHVTFVRNPGYYGAPKPYLDQITFKPVADSTVKADAMITGQAQLGWFPILDQSVVKAQSSGIKLNGVVGPPSIGVTFNTTRAPYNDQRVRQALVRATDLGDLNQKAGAGAAKMTTSWFPPGSVFTDPAVKPTTNKLAQAQKLIDAYVAEKGPVNGDLLVPQSLSQWGIPLLQQWNRLKNVNIQANVQPPTQSLTLGTAGNYNAYLAAAPAGTYVQTWYDVLHTGQTNNVTKYSDPVIDKLTEDNLSASTIPQRKSAISKITKRLVEQSVYTLLYYSQYQTATTKAVKGYQQWTIYHPDPAGLWLSS